MHSHDQILLDNFKLSSKWNNDQINSDEKFFELIFVNGYKYIGQINKNYLPHGQGKLIFNKNVYIESEWIDGVMQKFATLHTPDAKLIGKWSTLDFKDLNKSFELKELIFQNGFIYKGDLDLILEADFVYKLNGKGELFDISGKIIKKGTFK